MSLAVDELSVDEKSVDELSVNGLSPHPNKLESSPVKWLTYKNKLELPEKSSVEKHYLISGCS
jgi:hypothetical protein